jgi:hypothetical protein
MRPNHFSANPHSRESVQAKDRLGHAGGATRNGSRDRVKTHSGRFGFSALEQVAHIRSGRGPRHIPARAGEL